MYVDRTLPFRFVAMLLFCLGSLAASAASGDAARHAIRPAPLEGVQDDSSGELLWIGEIALQIDPDVLRELREVARIVAEDPDARSIERAAGRLSRRALAALDEVNTTLLRTGIAPPVSRAGVHCLGLTVDLMAAIGLYPASCRLLSIGLSGPFCAVELALLTGDAADLQACLERHGRNTGRGRDSDGDGVVDALDHCPYDPEKTWEGWCGCGVADRDDDGNGLPDCLDGCLEGDDDCDDMPDEGDCGPMGNLGGGCNPFP